MCIRFTYHICRTIAVVEFFRVRNREVHLVGTRRGCEIMRRWMQGPLISPSWRVFGAISSRQLTTNYELTFDAARKNWGGED